MDEKRESHTLCTEGALGGAADTMPFLCGKFESNQAVSFKIQHGALNGGSDCPPQQGGAPCAVRPVGYFGFAFHAIWVGLHTPIVEQKKRNEVNTICFTLFYLNLLFLPCECMLPPGWMVFRVVMGKRTYRPPPPLYKPRPCPNYSTRGGHNNCVRNLITYKM